MGHNMGWETRRNGRSYYYAKMRIGGKVSSIYIGTGPQAELIAEGVEAALQARKATTSERAEDLEVDRELRNLEKSVRESSGTSSIRMWLPQT
ncbi:MAG: hypothetical protein ACR2HJ_05630 [Fimbriimonadales bacterium]